MQRRFPQEAGWAMAAVAACSFVGWQYREFRHEDAATRTALERQSESLAQALCAGIRSHRRMGRFLDAQMQDVLDQLLHGPNVRAALIEDARRERLAAAGVVESLAPERQSALWQPSGLQTTQSLTVALEAVGGGRGPMWRRDELAATESAAPKEFAVTLLVDRRPADAAVARAARQRIFTTLAGLAALAGVAWAWRAQARGWRMQAQAQLLRAESQRLRELGEAAAGLAHETRNPLGVIRGNLQALAQRGDAPTAPLGVLIEECDRIASRINRFLAFARPPDPRFAAVDLERLARELRGLLEPDLDQRRVQFAWRMEAPPALLSADPELLRQILFNLLQNAVAFSPEEGEVTLSARRAAGDGWRIDVADSGPGVPQDRRERLFAPYFTTRPEGTGLGLATVKRLAEAQGWRIGFSARPQGGACFSIEGVDEAG